MHNAIAISPVWQVLNAIQSISSDGIAPLNGIEISNLTGLDIRDVYRCILELAQRGYIHLSGKWGAMVVNDVFIDECGQPIYVVIEVAR